MAPRITGAMKNGHYLTGVAVLLSGAINTSRSPHTGISLVGAAGAPDDSFGGTQRSAAEMPSF